VNNNMRRGPVGGQNASKNKRNKAKNKRAEEKVRYPENEYYQGNAGAGKTKAGKNAYGRRNSDSGNNNSRSTAQRNNGGRNADGGVKETAVKRNRGSSKNHANRNPSDRANKKVRVRKRTPEEIAAIKAERKRKAEIERQRIKAEKIKRRHQMLIELRSAFILFMGRAAITLGCTVVFFAVFVLFFFIGLYSRAPEYEGEYVYRVGIKEDTIYEGVYPASKMIRDGKYYIELLSAADYLDLTITGDADEIRFILRSGGNESVSFLLGSPIVSVNGMKNNLSVPVTRDEDGIWVPIEFFERYCNAIEINVDEENKTIRLSKSITEKSVIYLDEYYRSWEDNNEDNNIVFKIEKIEYLEPDLTLKAIKSTQNIPEYSLGEELLKETDPVANIITGEWTEDGDIVSETEQYP